MSDMVKLKQLQLAVKTLELQIMQTRLSHARTQDADLSRLEIQKIADETEVIRLETRQIIHETEVIELETQKIIMETRAIKLENQILDRKIKRAPYLLALKAFGVMAAVLVWYWLLFH
ncbi:hypothetical protein IQ22_03936 [Pseudomonas duriflava]|uniref:Uncharacterized protein n=1 Tax=Pseudomonas duriflava TaxID=459528 RepID=A0A562PYZ2_9PSED|nr:hypothetical protein [Pseudomonas duriflava]TWI49613.1 hypothetical protein IQ22_03936 [Pseudomonas duriflava]